MRSRGSASSCSAERGLDVIVKMNPPSIGREQMEHLLHDVMGYTEIRVNPSLRRQPSPSTRRGSVPPADARLPIKRGRNFGCKFSNTLEVINHRKFFTPDNKVMYLSGRRCM